jgi:hypothetical protein
MDGLTDDPEPLDISRTRQRWREAVRAKVDHSLGKRPNQLLARILETNERHWAREMDPVCECQQCGDHSARTEG